MTTGQILGRGALVVLIAAIVGGIAYYFSDSQEREYEATTKLLFAGSTPELRAVGLTESGDDEERNIANNVLQVSSFDVARNTAEALDDPAWDADAVDAHINAAGDRESDVITIASRAPSPREAAELVTAYRREYILRQREVVQARARVALAALTRTLRELPPLVRKSQRGDSLRTSIAQVSLVERTGGEPLIIEGVRATSGPVTPLVLRNTLFGVLFGAVLGVGLVALRGATVSRREPAEDPPSLADQRSESSRPAA